MNYAKKIVFFGTSHFAVPILNKLADSPFKPNLVVTQPDAIVGRKKILMSPPVKVAAPVVTTVHTPMLVDSRYAEPIDTLGVAIKLQATVSFRLEKALLRRSSLITTVSRAVAEELSEYGVTPESIAIIGNGVDHEVFHPAPGEAKSEPYVLKVARLAHRKGLFDVVRCAARLTERHPEIRFVLVGGGPLESRLRALVSELGLCGKVDFLGQLDYQSPALVRLYQECSVYMQASHYEGLPGTLLDAMACGRPVVATAIGGHLDAISPGENGVLVPPGDPEALAVAVGDMLEDRGMRERLGRAARRTVEEGYTWDLVTERVLACYRRALNGPEGVAA